MSLNRSGHFIDSELKEHILDRRTSYLEYLQSGFNPVPLLISSQQSMAQKYIRVKAAAKLIGYSESYISLKARNGCFTRYYMGERSYLLDRDEVLQYPKKRVIR